MLKLTGERNIHTSPPRTSSVCDHVAQAPDLGREPPPDFSPGLRKVRRSPAEELAARIAVHGRPESIPDGLAALIAANSLEVTIKADGIHFRFDGRSHHFYSPDSSTCHPANVGRTVTICFNRHRMDVVYVLDGAGRFVEPIPSATHPKWFDAQMERELADYRRVVAHTHQALRKTHRPTTTTAAERAKHNREQIQWANEFPPSAPGRQPACMPAADALQDGMDCVSRARAAQADADARAAQARRVTVTRRDMQAALADDRPDVDADTDLDEISDLLRD